MRSLHPASLVILYGTFLPFRHCWADWEGVDDGAAEVLDDEGVLLPQFPKPDWHPVPQYGVVEPHHPAEEQQFPNELPKHVYPVVPPQLASGETFLVGVG